MINASVYVITLNEEEHIRRMFESVKAFNEIIIVDSGSTDKTLSIAKEYTKKIYHQEWLGFSEQKELAKSYCSNEWVLNLDGDEQLSPELKNEIIDVIQENNIDGLDIKISSQYMGKFNHSASRFNRRVRFFRKRKGYYPPKVVHESIVVNGEIIKTKGYIYDYGLVNLQKHLEKINEYSSLRVIEKKEKGKKATIAKLVLIIPLSFFKSYILRRGILNGVRGFIGAVNNAYYAFLKEAKLYEADLRRKL